MAQHQDEEQQHLVQAHALQKQQLAEQHRLQQANHAEVMRGLQQSLINTGDGPRQGGQGSQ